MPTPVSIADVTTRTTPVSVFTDTSGPLSAGLLRTMSHTRIVKSRPRPAMLPNVIDQVVACSSAATGTNAINWPACPMIPVNWTMTGPRCAGNHVATSRSTAGKTAASPAPRRTRATIAMPMLGERAMVSCPAAMSSIPAVMIGRDP